MADTELPVVTLHLDIEPNDPRLFPPVDGNTQPKVDINVPVE